MSSFAIIQSDNYLKQISKKRKYDYKINKNLSWASLKFNIVRLFLNNNPKEILEELQKTFQQNLEPVRPDRQYQRQKKKKRTKGKYQTLTN